MRDIRADLKERLAHISGRYADEMVTYDEKRSLLEIDHRRSIAALEQERANLELLLTIEDKRHGEAISDELQSQRRALVPLQDFLLSKIFTHGPLLKEELRTEANAAGYFPGNNTRAFHTTLLNLVKHKRLQQQIDGRYVTVKSGETRTLLSREI